MYVFFSEIFGVIMKDESNNWKKKGDRFFCFQSVSALIEIDVNLAIGELLKI